MCKTPLYGHSNIQIELFHFDNPDSFAGAGYRKKQKDRMNEFIREHDGKILDVQFAGDDALVIYEI